MNKLKYLVLFIGMALFLAACGGNGTNGDGNGPGTGTLAIDVTPDEAEWTVTTGEGEEVQSGQGDMDIEDLEAGNYSITATADGYRDYGPNSFEVVADETTAAPVTLELLEGENVENVSIVEFADVNENTYPVLEEINPNKEAFLTAAQTEEQVGIAVEVTDADDNPVVDAPVYVNVTGDYSDSIAITPGYPFATQAEQEIRTDGDGIARFTIRATNADLSLQEILNAIVDDGQDVDQFQSVFDPIKIVVTSVGGDNVAKDLEFKSFFTNMSHLYYGEGDGLNEDGVVTMDEDTMLATGVRSGAEIEIPQNVWRNNQDNVHYFGTYADAKQPHSGPYPVGVGNAMDIANAYYDFIYNEGLPDTFPSAAGSDASYPTGLEGAFFGYVEYQIDGETVSQDDDGDPLVGWDAGLCDEADPGLTCTDSDGSGVGLVPSGDVTLEDLPIEATVTATYYFTVDYGEQTGVDAYAFPLKDYTFTKEWIGGFLTVDKHVEQHVLSWYGEDVTLDRSDAVSDEDYLATVHVTVENDSNSDIHNVTVRDAVPAELGVVTGSIEPDSGTYDPVNHVVTWSFNQEDSLETIAVGDTVEFTFDVYARHKPGYCWEGVDDGSFNVQPRYGAAPVEFGVNGDATDEGALQPAQECVPYGDPYRVTNGSQNQSVTAAGFFDEDDTTGEQLVFSYTPEADESDIWVVRPLFEITKTRISQPLMAQGASANFRIEVQQLDRVEIDTANDPTWTHYGDLATMYPWEFDDDTEGTGDQPHAYTVRNNPYAHDVEVADAFDVGLDFTNGTGFLNVDGGDIQTTAPTVEKEVTWDAITNLPVGVTGEASITLTGNLDSANEDGSANYTAVETTGATVDVDGTPYAAWQNCAYLDAPQLNQPAAQVESTTFTWYDVNEYRPWTQDQLNGQPADPDDEDSEPVNAGTKLIEDVEGAGTFFQYGVTELEDCANVAVFTPQQEPFVTLTTNGEFNGGEDASQPFVDDDNLQDGYQAGDTFVYKMTAQNAGVAQASNVVVSASIADTSVVEFDGDASLYRGSPSGWTHVETVNVSNASSISFSGTSLPAGQYLRVVAESVAVDTGVTDMQTQLNYANPPTTQATPLTTTEETSVQ